MSVEQTSQLIQLILNSALMALVSALVWGVLWLCHLLLEHQLQGVRQEWCDLEGDRLLHAAPQCSSPQFDRLDLKTDLKRRIYQLRQRYRALHRSMTWVGWGLQCFGASTFALALRAVWGWNGLISGAMLLFIGGCGLFWIGIVLLLWMLYRWGWRWPPGGSGSDRPQPTRQLSTRDPRPSVPALQAGGRSGGRSPIPPYVVPKSKHYLN